MIRIRTLAFLLIAFSAGCATAPTRDAELTDQGQAALAAGDAKKAEELLKGALAENPDNPYALAHLSTLYMGQSRYDLAKPLCERLIANESDYASKAKGKESEETRALVQRARDDMSVIEREQKEEQELLALTPDPPTAAPLVREPAAMPVSVAAVSTPASTDTPAAGATSRFHYRVQVGAFRSRINAERLIGRLNERHAEAMLAKEVQLAEADGLTKVQIGPYQSLKEASTACRIFSREGVRCFPKALR